MPASSKYVAFLRGMNVGGHRLTNAELRTHIEALGFSDVATFRASGNVILAAAERTPEDVRAHLEQGLETALGYAVPTFVRTAAAVQDLAAAEPFEPAALARSQGKLQVMLLGAQPRPAVRREVLAMGNDSDRVAFGERALFWLPSGPMLDSTLDLSRVESLIGPCTTRTKGTIEQIAIKHLAG